MAAFDALFLTKWYSPKMMRYFFAVMAHDSSRTIRRHVARNACHSLALLYTMGEFKATSKDNDNLLIEEDGSVPPEKMKDAKKSEVDLMIRALRKDRELGKSEVLREFLMPLVL
jgi:transcription initiation factor TFIID subunit 2